MAMAAKAALGVETLDAVADRGYFSGEEILECENAGITVTLPKPMTSNSKAEGRFGKQDFRYVAEDDVYICPAGQRLTYSFTTEDKGLVLRRYATKACQNCAIKNVCTTAKQRLISRWEHEHVLETVQRRLDEHPEKMRQRRGDGQAPLRHDQSPDGCHPLPDEDAATGGLRDGAACAGLQHDEGDEHHGRPAADGSDEVIIAADKRLVCCCRTAQDAGIPIRRHSERETAKLGKITAFGHHAGSRKP